jgi:hypothetical protein
MTRIVETAKIAEDADALWNDVGKFGAVGRWHTMLARVENDGEAMV